MPSPQKVVAVVYERFQLDGFGLLHDSFLPQRSSFIPDSGLWSTVADASSAVRNIGKNSWNDGGDATPLPSWLLHPASNPPPPPPPPPPNPNPLRRETSRVKKHTGKYLSNKSKFVKNCKCVWM